MATDFSNPLAVILPYSFNAPQDYPTEVLASRFQAWRTIIKDLVNYLKEYASVQEEIVRQQLRLQQAVGISASRGAASGGTNSSSGGGSSASHGHGHAHNNNNNPTSSNKDDINAVNKFFLPVGNGSVQDLPSILTKFHQQNVANASRSLKEINQIIIPKLDELRKDLLVKIKEIKNLQNDFKNNLAKETSETRSLLNQYQHAIELSNKLEHGSSASTSGNEGDAAKFDPYLVKLKLDRQLKRQVSEENYLYDAYENLQTAGGKLESIIVMEIQTYLKNFVDLINVENSTIPNFLVPSLTNGFLTKEPNFEWDSFISKNLPSPSISISAVSHNTSSIKNGSFIDLSFPARKLADLSVPNIDSPLNIALREGFLERRSKYLKSYSSGWYVLTCNFFHEFKTPDRKKDQVPALSLSLDQCHVSDHSRDDGKANGVYKFYVYTKSPTGLISKGHNLVFRTDTYKTMIDWYNDIKALTSLPTPAARARYVAKNFKPSEQKKVSRNPSIVSSSTNARSIKSGTTINSRLPHNIASTPRQHQTGINGVLHSGSTGGGGARSRPVSQASSSANNNRLSSTFSQKNNNQSPRLSNMINSDGTIITPVETYNEYQQHQQSQQQHDPRQHQQQHQQQQQQHQQVQQLPPQIQQLPHQLSPQQPIPVQLQTVPQGYVPTAQSYQYYINNNNENQPQQQQQQQQQQPPQQFYDPVQQQFYTISPSVQPQPQFFPASPQGQPPRQYITVAPNPDQQSTSQGGTAGSTNGNGSGNNGSAAGGYTINTANYFPQQFLSTDAISSNGQLPYPVSSQIQSTSTGTSRQASTTDLGFNGVNGTTNGGSINGGSIGGANDTSATTKNNTNDNDQTPVAGNTGVVDRKNGSNMSVNQQDNITLNSGTVGPNSEIGA